MSATLVQQHEKQTTFKCIADLECFFWSAVKNVEFFCHLRMPTIRREFFLLVLSKYSNYQTKKNDLLKKMLSHVQNNLPPQLSWRASFSSSA